MDSAGGSSTIENSASNQSTKQTPAGAVVSTATPVQTPPFTALMQQAVAMQQYHFQQALMMQQAIAAQQAVSRAASVKTAAEMAAARAAEISKQLKGNDAEGDKSAEESKSRSRSKSASRSLSVSRSKSRSRSPIRYRRGRSISRSPIRYRRDYYSPSRTRDYYSYRNRGYRGYYYRGRSDYSWNLYRRERDRDYFYRSSRRSRSRGRMRSGSRSRTPRRSRSRGRRSPTLSRSPRRSRRSHSNRHRREKSVSPRHKHEERKSHRSSKRSTSVEVRRSPSVSSRSITSSPAGNGEKSSSSNAIQDKHDVLYKEASPAEVEGKGIGCESSIGHLEGPYSPVNQEQSGSICRRSGDRISVDKAELLSSPARSLSVSVEHDQNKKLASTDEFLEGKLLQDHCNDDLEFYDEKDNTDQVEFLSSKEVSEKNCNCKISDVEKASSGQEVGRGKRAEVPKTLLGDESEDNERLDDWRDDLRYFLKEKGNGSANYGRRGPECDFEQPIQRGEVLKASIVEAVEIKLGEDDCASSEEEMHNCPSNQMKLRGQASPAKVSGGYSTASEDRCDQGYGEYGEYYSQSLLNEMGLEADAENVNDQDRNWDAKNIQNEREGEEEIVFEGPRPASEDYEKLVHGAGFVQGESEVNGREVEDASRRRKKLEKRHKKPLEYQKSTDSKAWSGSEEDHYSGREGAECILERDEGKMRSRLKPKDSRRYEEDAGKREKHRHRHRRHRQKHRYEDSDVERDDMHDERKDDGEGHKGRKRHRKRHKKDGDHEHRDRKRRKHKHRVRSPSVSLEDSFLHNADGVKGDGDHNAMRKRGLKRHRKSRRDLSRSLSIGATSSD